MGDAATQDRWRNERAKLWIFREIAKWRRWRHAPWLTAATCSMTAGNGSYHGLAPSFSKEMTRCRRHKLHWRWPGNPNGWSKFRNLGLFTFTRLQLTLRRRLCGRRRLPKIAQTARCRRQKHRRRWPGSIEIPQIHAYTIKQSVSKNFFLLLRTTP